MGLFKGIDCVMVRVGDLAEGIRYYSDFLGHELIWKTELAAGLKLPDSNAELVLHTEVGPETDFFVEDATSAFQKLIEGGAKAIRAPFDVQIGKCAVVQDPWGNVITIIDCTKGLLKTDEDRNVVGNYTHPSHSSVE